MELTARGHGGQRYADAPAPSPPGDDSMITRQGRSASTVSSVLPNTRAAAGAPRQRHDDRLRAHLLAPRRRSGAPPRPARTFSQWPETRRPPCTLACSMTAWAASSCSGSSASIGLALRHRDRHQHVDPAAAPGGQPRPRSRPPPGSSRRSSKATSTDSYSASWSTTGLRDRDLRGRRAGRGPGCGGRRRRRRCRAPASRMPASADVDVQHGHGDERDARCRGRRGPRTAAARGRAMRSVPGPAVGPRARRAGRLRRRITASVRDRERQHRAERVHVAEERRPGPGSASGRRSPPKTMIPIHGVR